jgi:hypothetical protein
VIEVAATIAPVCGMTIFEVMWNLPIALAYQIFFVQLQQKGLILIHGESDSQLLRRLRRCQM